jgi:hypothetical protein
MDTPEVIRCPKCGRAGPAEFRVRRYRMVPCGQLSLDADDCEYHCPCGAMFHEGMRGRTNESGRNPLLIETLLALLNGAFEVGVLAFGRREAKAAGV